MTSFSCRGKNINKCEGAEANEIQLIFFPFSDEIKEIERTNTSNQGAKICFVFGEKFTKSTIYYGSNESGSVLIILTENHK